MLCVREEVECGEASIVASVWCTAFYFVVLLQQARNVKSNNIYKERKMMRKREKRTRKNNMTLEFSS